MANFVQAIQWMKDGNKVCRDGHVWHLELDGLKNIRVFFLDEDHSIQNISIDDIESSDWNIYKDTSEIQRRINGVHKSLTKIWEEIIGTANNDDPEYSYNLFWGTVNDARQEKVE